MAHILYEKFEDLEADIRRTSPPVVYKYRGDWKNQYHRDFITKKEIWFAAPRELNDPYDIRVPVEFDISELDNPEIFKKIMNSYLVRHPNIAFGERELRVICENKLEEIKLDPKRYFESNYRDIRESEIYDQVGLFSCTTDPLNEVMWAHYGNNGKGFVVGFDTVELERTLLSLIGSVIYSDDIQVHSFLEDSTEFDLRKFFQKSTKWAYEKEYRFLVFDDHNTIRRRLQYSELSVKEVILGHNFPQECITEFVHEVVGVFGKKVPIYRIEQKTSGFGFDKKVFAIK